MNEEKKDKVIEMLKEINDILKETNLEMAKNLQEGKKGVERYVLYDPINNAYATSHYSNALGDFEHAEVFSKFDALATISYLESVNKECDFIIAPVKVIKGE